MTKRQREPDTLSEFERGILGGHSARIDIPLMSPLVLREYGEELEALGKYLCTLSYQQNRAHFDVLRDAVQEIQMVKARLRHKQEQRAQMVVQPLRSLGGDGT